MLSQLIIMLNNFIKYSSTYLIFIEIFYEFKIKKSLNMLNRDDLNFEEFIKEISKEIRLTPQQASQQFNINSFIISQSVISQKISFIMILIIK